LKCPHCGRDFESVEGQVFCSFCGGRLDSTPESPPRAGRDDRAEENDPIAIDESALFRSEDGYCPWEDQERLGLFRAMAETVKETLLTPSDFFSRLPLRGGFISPLLYALILGTLGAMIGSVWGFLSENPLLIQATRQSNLTILVGVFIPVVVFLAIVASAALLHGSLFLLGGARESFEATFRVVCYSETTQILNIVPVIGSVAGWIWRVYILTLGLKEVHGISTGKAVMGVLLPFVVTCLFAVALVSMVAVGLDPG
jgi:hypothetical protein